MIPSRTLNSKLFSFTWLIPCDDSILSTAEVMGQLAVRSKEHADFAVLSIQADYNLVPACYCSEEQAICIRMGRVAILVTIAV